MGGKLKKKLYTEKERNGFALKVAYLAALEAEYDINKYSFDPKKDLLTIEEQIARKALADHERSLKITKQVSKMIDRAFDQKKC